MPYVEVWVEDECDGTCAASKDAEKLQARIDEAADLIRSGEPTAALHALTEDSALPVKTPHEIASTYKVWKAGKLPGFTNYQP